jgi:hypothetical protein
MSQFTAKLELFEKVTNRRVGKVIGRAAFIAFSRVVMRSPVDTGRFRGNWQMGIDEQPVGELDALDKTGSTTVSEAENIAARAKIGDDMYIVNNLPYADRLENGWSQQAPAGIVALTVAEWPGIVADAVEAEK